MITCVHPLGYRASSTVPGAGPGQSMAPERHPNVGLVFARPGERVAALLGEYRCASDPIAPPRLVAGGKQGADVARGRRYPGQAPPLSAKLSSGDRCRKLSSGDRCRRAPGSLTEALSALQWRRERRWALIRSLSTRAQNPHATSTKPALARASRRSALFADLRQKEQGVLVSLLLRENENQGAAGAGREPFAGSKPKPGQRLGSTGETPGKHRGNAV